MFYTLSATNWTGPFSAEEQENAVAALEDGKVIYLPKLSFELKPSEKELLTPEVLGGKSKNISFNPQNQKLKGVSGQRGGHKMGLGGDTHLSEMMVRFFQNSQALLNNLIPGYQNNLIHGRTSYRPVEVEGRKTSLLKDDTRVHVDAFSATPNGGKRILRVFTNIHPGMRGRLWHLGEPFKEVVEQFLPKLKKPYPGYRTLLSLLKLTKSYRTLYDHYMLKLHDEMKKNETYQQSVQKTVMDYPPGSTWVVMTDQVSHAALKGQFMLEQTFYLPVRGMANPDNSPLHILQQVLKQALTR